jgi:hypothetical protein
MRGRMIPPLEQMLEANRWTFGKVMYEIRHAESVTWQQLGDAFGIHRSTARLYARMYELHIRVDSIIRNESEDEQPPSCNAVSRRCAGCDESFVASRGDARYCSNACRQDAYRKRKSGMVLVAP